MTGRSRLLGVRVAGCPLGCTCTAEDHNVEPVCEPLLVTVASLSYRTSLDYALAVTSSTRIFTSSIAAAA